LKLATSALPASSRPTSAAPAWLPEAAAAQAAELPAVEAGLAVERPVAEAPPEDE
jgi:hypothetical protein